MKPVKLIILSAPSGAGKTTVARYLLAQDPGLEFSVSACSRPVRKEEVNGKDYYFLTPEEFRNRIDQHDFIEWEEVYPNHYYGTLQSEIDRIAGKGHAILFDVDVKGGINLKQLFQEQALSIFIMPPSVEVLKERLQQRSSDAPEHIRMRLKKAELEMQEASKFDHILVNDQLSETLEKAKVLVNKFLYGTS